MTVLEQRVLGGRYRLDDELGSGGMAVVWRAHDEVLGRSVAVKVLAGRYAGDARSRRRIRAEARIAAALSHPNIAQVYDFGETQEDGRPTPYVVMELVAGPTLTQRLAEGPLPPPAVFRVCAEVAAALTAAHAAGLVHRDIKPANVILTSAGAKVVDFGIAASVSPGGVGELPAEVLGTPLYLAPERLTDDAVEPASDIYALGVLLYKLLAGHLPWNVDTPTQILTAHIYTEPTPLPELPSVPGDVADLCLRCLRKDPLTRPGAPEVAAVLAGAAGMQVVTDERAQTMAAPSVLIAAPVLAPAPASEPAPDPESAGHSRFLVAVWGTVAVAAVAVVLASSVLHRWPGSPRPTDAALPSVSAHAAAGASQPVAGTTGPGTPSQAATGGVTTGPAVPGAQPGQPGPAPFATQPAPTAAPPTGAPKPQPRTLSSSGGSVEATCTGTGLAHLLSWTPAQKYKTDRVEPGPAQEAVAVFQHGNDRFRMVITCAGGVPSAATTSS